MECFVLVSCVWFGASSCLAKVVCCLRQTFVFCFDEVFGLGLSCWPTVGFICFRARALCLY